MRYSVDGQILTDIADAINAKTGGTTALAPGDMADEIESIPSGGGGRGYATGTYTLAAAADKIEFNPGLSFTPKIFAIYANSPSYADNGCVGATLMLSVPIDLLGPDSRLVHYCYDVMETRATWGTNSHLQANQTIANVDPALTSTAVSMPCRNGNYKWFAGEYTWEAWE